MRSAARVYLLLGLLAMVAYVVVGPSNLIYELFGAASWIAIAVGIRRNRPERAGGWWLLGATQFLFAIGDIVYDNAYGSSPPYPSLADVFYLAGDVSFVLALLYLAGRGRRTREALIDAAVISMGLGIVLWSLFLDGRLGPVHGAAGALTIAYPICDMVLLAMLVRVLLEHNRRSPSYWLILVGLTSLLASDAWYVVPALTDRYTPGWRDLGWLAGYLFTGAAALHPSMRSLGKRHSVAPAIVRVLLLGASLVLVALAAVVQEAVHGSVDVYVYSVCVAVVAVCVTVRTAGLVRRVELMHRQASESERRFRLIFERAPIGISVGRDGVMSDSNPALQRMLGYSRDDLTGMHYTSVTDPDHLDLVEQAELDQGLRSSFAVDKRYVRKDGTSFDAHVIVALDVDDGLGISLIEDVSERRTLEQQLREAQKMEAIGKLAGGVAHDFNNLMTAVLGYSDLVLKRLDRGDVNREKIEAIRDSAMRASDLTRQLLAFGRRQMLQAAEVDLRDVVSRMETLLRPLLGESIVLETSFGSDPVVVRADRTQLEQALVNLAANARDAMPAGGTFRLEVEREGQAALLRVSDSGAGMDPLTLSRAFEPFFTTKPVGSGPGLGLSTVHGIVGQSGGTVEAESELGRGTVFTIRLPLARIRLTDESINSGGDADHGRDRADDGRLVRPHGRAEGASRTRA